MDNNIFLSYIIPCYNVEKYLPRCIKSLEKQKIDGFDIEFVFINDGSADDSLRLIREFAARDRRVVVLNQENQGVSAARNNGLTKARGTYVFFLDGDDWMTDAASQYMYDACKNDEPDIIIMGNYKAYEKGLNDNTIWVDAATCTKDGVYDKYDFIKRTRRLPISSKVYRSEFLRTEGITFDSSLIVGEVYAFFIHALTRAKKVGVSEKYIMVYLRRDSNSATSKPNIDRDCQILNTLHSIDDGVSRFCEAIQDLSSYKKSLFWLVTAFAVIKYAKKYKYTSEIGYLMKAIKNDNLYNSLLRYMLSGEAGLYYSTLSALIYFLPPSVSYRLIRNSIRFYQYFHNKN